MLYLNNRDIQAIGQDWSVLINTMESAVRIVDTGHFAQPVKPYLRYNHPKNRIIAMPAYAGGEVHTAGIKWIASFPDNIRVGLPRAHSIIVLNDPDTGRPSAILNSPLPSIARTASVSGVMMRHFLQARPSNNIQLGIIGWGPIGRYHYKMATNLFGEQIEQIRIYDIQTVDLSEIPAPYRERTIVSESWRDVYNTSDIFITCTVSDDRYIDCPPKEGSLLLNVSLRDYKLEALSSIKAVIVDDWDEVCRENTDIEHLHLQRGLTRSDTRSITDVVSRQALLKFAPDEPIFFNPMGMAVFDIATAVYYVKQAKKHGFGMELD